MTTLPRYHSKNLAALEKDYHQRGKNLHHYDFNDCPIWALSEVMSIGQLSRWHSDTNLDVRKLIAGHYQLPYQVVKSLLPHLTLVRNFCAHHELLWDRKIVSSFLLPRRVGTFSNPGTFFNETETGKLYNTLVMIAYLTKLKPRWDVHSRGDEDRLGCASEALPSILEG